MPISSSFRFDPILGVCYRTLHCIGLPFYKIGTDGSFWSRYNKGGRLTNEWRQIAFGRRDGYITHCVEGGKRLLALHRMVLIAFVGPCPKGMECRHLNGIPWDNRLENLCWGTYKENSEDTIRHGRQPLGDDHHRTTIRKKDEGEILRLWGIGMTICQIASQFHVGRGAVRNRLKRLGVKMKMGRRGLHPEDIPNIRSAFCNRESIRTIAFKYGVSYDAIRNVILNKVWKGL